MSQITRHNDIFSYIVEQESLYQRDIQLPGNWSWNFLEHLTTSFLYTNGQLNTGKDDFTPIKNITLPILNLQHWTEDIDLTDVQIYVDSDGNDHLSFLIKKYHDDVFVIENDLDAFFDELNVSRIDYGIGISKKRKATRPDVVDPLSIAFCDQTDFMAGPSGIKHFFSPDQLMEMADMGWGDPAHGASASLEDVIRLAQTEKQEDHNNTKSDTPGKYIEVYEVHGTLPATFLDASEPVEKYVSQIQIVTFYEKEDKTKGHITLFKAQEEVSPFKVVLRDPIYGRCAGRGAAEEIFEDQVWTNYDEKRIMDMMDAASKTILISEDGDLVDQHPDGFKDLDNLEILKEAPGGNTRQLDTFPRNLQLFVQHMDERSQHAKDTGASQDSLQGKEPVSGTPFVSLQAQLEQGLGLHKRRMGQFARHIEEIYTDWFMRDFKQEITKGVKFLSTLSLEDIQYVVKRMVENKTNKMILEKVLAGEIFDEEEIEAFRELAADEIRDRGEKQFLELLKGEFKDKPLVVKVSVAGKSKNLAEMTDKIVSIWRFIFSNPQGFIQTMQIPGMGKAFNQLLEFSGMSPADFSGIEKFALPAPETATKEPPSPTPVNG